MKSLFLIALAVIISHASAQINKPAAASPPAPKLATKDIRVLPFAREFKEQKFKSNDHEMPDELRVNVVTTGLHLYGKKRGETARVQNRPTGHVGKVVLLPVGNRSGQLSVKVTWAEEVTYYYAVLEVNDALETTVLKLVPGKNYDWSFKTENGQSTLKVADGAAELASLSGTADAVKGFGFAGTVRTKGNEADLTITLP